MKNLIRHIQQSLALKLSFGIQVLAMLVFAAMMGILFVQSRSHIKSEAADRVGSALNVTVERTNSLLGTVETAVSSNEWLVTENFQPESLLAFSRRIVALNPNTSGCSIATEPYIIFPEYGSFFSACSIRKGDSIVTIRGGEHEYLDKTWYKTPRELGQGCWVDSRGDHHEDMFSASETIISYCKPLYDAKGKMIGVISADVSLSMLVDVIQEEKPTPNAYYAILGSKGHFLWHPDSIRQSGQTIFEMVLDKVRQKDMIALGYQITAGDKGSMEVNVNGKPCLVCYQPIAGTGWSLAVVCPKSDILGYYNRITLGILLLTAGGLLFIFLFCRRVVNRVIRPLNLLLEQSQHIVATGHFSELLPTTKRKDAVGWLQNCFALMQRTLRQRVNDVLRANEERARRNEELRQVSLEAEDAVLMKNTFIQNMTHQIRTPLNIIIGFAQVLRDSSNSMPPEEMKSISGVMNYNTTALWSMMLMLYDTSEVGTIEEDNSSLQDVRCNEVAREAVEVIAKWFGDVNIDFHTTIPDTLTVKAEPVYLGRTIAELLRNSVKYSDKQHISLTVSAHDAVVRLAFEDRGGGISPDYQPHIFQPFTKVDDLSEGLGLGLPLAKRHIMNMGGTLILDPTYHEGCRFIIELSSASVV